MYTTKCEVPLNFTLPELTSSNEVEFTLAIDDTERSSRHEMRISRDLLQVLGNDIFFPKGLLSWNNTTIVQMKSSQWLTKLLWESMEGPLNDHDEDYYDLVEEDFPIYLKGEHSHNTTSKAQNNLDANTYKKSDIKTAIEMTCKHLLVEEKVSLKILLHRYEILFNGTLGKWNTKPIKLEVKPESWPSYSKTYPTPQVHEAMLKKEVQQLEGFGVLKHCTDSKWAATTFIICTKERWYCVIHIRFQKAQLGIKMETFPNTKHPGCSSKAQKIYVCHFSGSEHELILAWAQSHGNSVVWLYTLRESTSININDYWWHSWQSRHFPAG